MAYVRKPKPKRHLPNPDADMVSRIEDYLLTSYECRRPPVVASRMLALMIELYHRNESWPERSEVAEFLDCSVYGLDAAISVALHRGLLTMAMDCEDSTELSHRVGVVKHRYYIPDKQLLLVAEGRRRRAA